ACKSGMRKATVTFVSMDCYPMAQHSALSTESGLDRALAIAILAGILAGLFLDKPSRYELT
ncbi:MAG: hypothetical protein AAFN68_11380, partial [Pseudomonadota bacterium]